MATAAGGRSAGSNSMPTHHTVEEANAYSTVPSTMALPSSAGSAGSTSTGVSSGFEFESSLVLGGVATRGSEPMLGISAQELMEDGCSHCGWVRKLGGNVHNWKRRYMILKKGCIYYYKDENTANAKGQFTLNNYTVEEAQVPKMNWCFKLVHIHPKKRTYFVSTSSEPELQMWIDKIQKDIGAFCLSAQDMPSPASPASPTATRPVQPASGATSPQPATASPPSSASALQTGAGPGRPASHTQNTPAKNGDPDDDSSDGEGIYDKARSDATPFDPLDGPPPAPPSRSASVKRPAVKPGDRHSTPQRAKTVKAFQPLLSSQASQRPKPPLPFSHRQQPMGEESGMESPTPKGRNSKMSATQSPAKIPDKIPPPLPGEEDYSDDDSDDDSVSAHSIPPLPPDQDTEEDSARDYLDLTEGLTPSLPDQPELPEDESHATYINTARVLTAMQRGTPDGSSTMPQKQPMELPPKKDPVPNQPSRPVAKPRSKAPMKKLSTVDQDSGDDDDDSDSGYIHPDISEFLPKSAFQDDMDRDKADSFLRTLNKNGCYVIRGTSRGTSEAKKVLSVWAEDRCRHYKIFFRKGLGFSLHGDRTFPDMQTLLSFYHHTILPRCQHKLTGPYLGVIKR